jgi:alpha-mannosidase
LQASWEDWARCFADTARVAPLNTRDHIAWARGQQTICLGQEIIVPSALQGYSLEGLELRLSLTWWAEVAQIFVNGELIQEGDLFDHSARVVLSKAVQPGEAIAVLIHLVSPGHDEGALVKSLCVYERADQSVDTCPEPGFVADELAVLQEYLTQFLPEQLEELTENVAQINWAEVGDRSTFDQSLTHLRQSLMPLSEKVKTRSIQLVGHSHLDLAWLWDVAETWEAAERTFKSVLQLQQDFPELTFCHTSPALYAWIEENRPELFAAIQRQVTAGRWEVVAGLWLEPELNLVGGESLVRQVLYGQRYVQEKFGSLSKVAWLPDSFGFCWQLPQILKQGGVDYFVTQKLRWNDTTQFPHEVFRWEAADRSQILSLNSAPIGEGIDPVKMAKYAFDWETKTGFQRSLWLPGVGDHGGGPTRDMLQVAQRWQRSPFFPEMKFGTVLDFLETIEKQSEIQNEAQNEAQINSGLPVWNEDLYLEFHRGCYTTHADQKLRNRRCEELLYEAELFASIATLLTGVTYPKAEIESAWKKVLFNQFHDILPGSAIPKVYEDADAYWLEAENVGGDIRDQALGAIATQIHLPEPPHPEAQAIAVFNALNWERSQIVEVSSPSGNWQVCSLEGFPQMQVSPDGRSISFLAETIPALGYRCFWLCPIPPASAKLPSDQNLECSVLENKFLRITIDPTTGDLSSIFDKLHQREVLNGAGNELQAFRDEGQYWDAWNIDPNYAQHPLPVELVGIHLGVQNALEKQIWVERKIGRSLFRQAYILQNHSPILRIKTEVDWQERHVLVKAAFSLNVEADYATYEIPFGAIQRTTKRESDRQKAQWEVPALRWADLGDDAYGISLLNDCKYGYDAQPHQIRLTLLRGAEWPNPHADQGKHEFTYALYPHEGDWRSARTVHQGYELNQLLRVVKLSGLGGKLPAIGQFFDLPNENLVITAFKQSEDDPKLWVLRCYECHGEPIRLTWQNNPENLLSHRLDLKHPDFANLLEAPTLPKTDELFPWKITTFLLPQL